MRKASYYIIFIFILFLIFVPNVNADKGDLNYEITNVIITDNKITIEGWAFIHRTHNYVTVYERKSNGVETQKVVKSNGGQKVKIKLEDSKGNKLEKEYKCKNTPNGYNFYYQQFYKGLIPYNVNTYNNSDKNKCSAITSTQCYYEDLDFSITFSLDEIYEKFSAETDLKFSIAAYNNHYGKYTKYEILKTPRMNWKSDFIDISSGNVNGEVKFIAIEAILRKLNGDSTRNSSYESIGVCSASSDVNKFCDPKNSTYYIYDLDSSGFVNGYKKGSNDGLGGVNFLNNTLSPSLYAICVNRKSNKKAPDACSSKNDNGFCTKCPSGGRLLATYSSWVTLSGTNQLRIRVKDEKKCEVTKPLPDNLQCNNSGALSSTCDELTVKTDEGSAVVKIEQVGTVSSVLTPDSTYAGGGFKFGIMYYNNIKWSYVGKKPNDKLHNAINAEMNKKIKNFDSYIADINITNLKLGNSVIKSGMVKKCSSSSSSKNYYGKNGITVSCVFTFPDSIIKSNGDVDYTSVSSSSLNINNKYYTEVKDNGKYPVTATITGMSRITDSSAKEDSADKNNKPWTGIWTDSIDGCVINLYPLLKTKPKETPGSTVLNPNFIYRPIDINNPFPNRNAGINWFDWYDISSNKDRLENTYNSKNLEYKAVLDNETIANIKKYNKNKNYLDWNSINDKTGKSSFINDYNYVVRVGGN